MATRAVIVNWEDAARKRLFAATDSLAERLGIAPVERENRVSHLPEPTPRSAGDLEAVAILAEAVAALSLELDELKTARKGARS